MTEYARKPQVYNITFQVQLIVNERLRLIETGTTHEAHKQSSALNWCSSVDLENRPKGRKVWVRRDGTVGADTRARDRRVFPYLGCLSVTVRRWPRRIKASRSPFKSPTSLLPPPPPFSLVLTAHPSVTPQVG